MDKRQLCLMWAIILAFILIALFPPMDVTNSISIGDPRWHGTEWRFIFADSQWRESSFGALYTANHIKAVAWTSEFIILGVVSAGLWFSFARKGDT